MIYNLSAGRVNITMKIMVIVDKWSSYKKEKKCLIEELLDSGYEVILLSVEREPFFDSYNKRYKLFYVSTNGQKYVSGYFKFMVYCLMAYKVLKPDKILLHLSKGTLAAGIMFRLFKNTMYSVIIESLQQVKSKRSIMYRLMYRYIIGRSKTVFFVYNDDYEMADRFKFNCKDRAVLLRSWGVNIEKAYVYPLPKTDLVYMSMPVLCSHGIKCFIETAKIVREKYPKVRFLLSGTLAEESTVLSEGEFNEACESKHIYYIGDTPDIRPYLEVCSIFVQINVSVREGHIIEAEAAGRPILASDHPVNRSLVIEGYNGFILPANDAKKWADKIFLLLENKELKANMADCSRELCGRMHDSRIISKLIKDKLEQKLEITWRM
ncbi:glycosyltransferase involved in cell wall biosynthesis [Herbinix hemicellulosilytica]|uniref:Uncharacterized protein n=2 Tax=Herbinix hemicellulosilytica TaxID=1564487 RepID=A0A0H5SGV2_HERHM|nr:glycosyltransferase involved in cell wall biosynthesis [Herbinix hemicellulosilytica]CRZ34732.1 hypothetical protein HHT355_1531 [Herbinix hemicellulosilytica]